MMITQLLDFRFEALETNRFLIHHDKQLLGAQTFGDGTCALHAIFGQPQFNRGPLVANNVRQIVVEKLNMSLDVFLNNNSQISLQSLMEIFEVLWRELGIIVATKKNKKYDMNECSSESLILWNALLSTTVGVGLTSLHKIH